jgi:hypothetical protein
MNDPTGTAVSTAGNSIKTEETARGRLIAQRKFTVCFQGSSRTDSSPANRTARGGAAEAARKALIARQALGRPGWRRGSCCHGALSGER